MKMTPAILLFIVALPFTLLSQSYTVPSLLSDSDSLRPIGGNEDPWGYLVITRHHEMYSLESQQITKKEQVPDFFRYIGERRLIYKEDKKAKVLGMMDPKMTIIIAPKFQEIKNFKEGLALAKYGNYWGVIDTMGKFVIPPAFEWLKYNQDWIEGLDSLGQLAVFTQEGEARFRTEASPLRDRRKLKYLYHNDYFAVKKMKDALLFIGLDGKQTLIEHEEVSEDMDVCLYRYYLSGGKTPLCFDSLSTFRELKSLNAAVHFIRLKSGWKYYHAGRGQLKDIVGNIAAVDIKRQRAIVSKSKPGIPSLISGIMNAEGEIIFEGDYQEIKDIHLQYYKINNKQLDQGLLDKETFEEIIPPVFRHMEFTTIPDLVLLKKDKHWSLFNVKTRKLQFLVKSSSVMHEQGLFKVSLNEDNYQYGIMDASGKLLYTSPEDNLPSPTVTENAIEIQGENYTMLYDRQGQPLLGQAVRSAQYLGDGIYSLRRISARIYDHNRKLRRQTNSFLTSFYNNQLKVSDEGRIYCINMDGSSGPCTFDLYESAFRKLNQQEVAEALAFFEEAYEKNPTDPVALMSAASYRLEDSTQLAINIPIAEKELQRVKQIRSDHIQVIALESNILTAKKQYKAARQLLLKHKKKFEANAYSAANFYYQLGYIDFKKGDAKAAAANKAKAIELAPREFVDFMKRPYQ